jgi:hypothetical protein
VYAVALVVLIDLLGLVVEVASTLQDTGATNLRGVVPSTIVTIGLCVGLLVKSNLARLARTGFAILTAAFSAWIGFWAPYGPGFARSLDLPKDFVFPTAAVLNILYSLFVLWILTRPSTVGLFTQPERISTQGHQKKPSGQRVPTPKTPWIPAARVNRILELNSEPSSQSGVVCQRCGGSTERGRAILRGTPLGFMIRGWSYAKLFFAPQGDPRSEYEILPQGRSLEAHRCLQCGSLNFTKRGWVA